MTDKADDSLSLWTLFDHPVDHPTLYVLRRTKIFNDGAVEIDQNALAAQTVEPLRKWAQDRGLVNIGRNRGDDEKILEVWI